MEYPVLFSFEFLLKNNLFINVETHSERKVMSYNYNNNTIKINLEMLEEIKDGYLYYLSEDEIITVMLCHEIGHYLEFKNNKELPSQFQYYMFDSTREEYIEFILEREKVAWENGKQYVPKDLLEEYDRVNERNINDYISYFNR